MRKFLSKSIRKTKAVYKGWSAEDDRNFHDRHFSTPEKDVFDFSYPGYITILRFADLVEPFLKGLKTAVDVGCGPAEITCELARRFPRIQFTGIDHSTVGIEKAGKNAKRLNLKNVKFEKADAVHAAPECHVDIVLLFDSFHHLTDPNGFIKRMGAFTSRFLLIEPIGDWKGIWKKEMEFDWLLDELEKIRSRIDQAMEEDLGRKMDHSEPASPPDSEAVEHRYSLNDFYEFFKDYGLRIRGTISGLDAYPPGSQFTGPSSRLFGEFAYNLYKHIDEYLMSRDVDMLSKHLVIYAEKGKKIKKRKFPGRIPKESSHERVQGPYDVRYSHYKGPHKVNCQSEFKVQLKVQNRSFRSWSSYSRKAPDFISYHWLTSQRKTAVHDGERSSLPREISPGQEAELELKVIAPGEPGKYLLAIDLVQEGIAWFSESGNPCLQIPVNVKK